MALLAAGLSFAVSSCEKVRTSVSEEGDAEVTEQTVDFSEITKTDMDKVSESEEGIQDAIEDIVKSIAKQLGKAGEAVEGAIDDFQTELFDLFTYYGDTRDFSFSVKSEKFFKFLFEYTVNNKNVIGSDGTANYVSVSCKDRVLEIKTKDGYWLKVYLPSWISGVYDKGGKLDFSTDLFKDCVYAVEIGKEDVVYGRKVLDTKEERATLTIYDLNVNDREIAGATVDYSDPDDVVTSVWYDNAEVKVKDSLVVGTNIKATDLDGLFCTLSEMEDTYSYQPEDALNIVNDFNANVLAYDELNTLHHPTIKKGNLTYPDLATPALVEGKPLCAAYFTEARTQLCRVVVMHGDKVVTTGSVLEFVRYLLGETKKEQTLSFTPAPATGDSYAAYVGKDFEEPALQGAHTYVTYTSSDEEVATVGEFTGEVTPVAKGECEIKASAAAGVLYKAASASYKIKVSAMKFAKDTCCAVLGSSKQVTNDLTGAEEVSYSSSNAAVATVGESDGKVTLVGAGTCTITATDSPCSVSYVLIVKPVLLSGEFSVSATKKVQFTSANLYYDGSGWDIETEQTAYPESWDANHVGHFYWTKDAANSYVETYPEESSAAVTDKFFADGSDADHALTVDGESGLYALSKDEWCYLLNTGNAGSGARTGDRFAKANVNGVKGLIIFPDGYTGTRSGDGIADVNATAAAFPATSIASAIWSAMESAGCVFLPAAGSRYNGTSLDYVGSLGYYWSSTPKEESIAYDLFIGTTKVGVDLENPSYRKNGYSVRLVKGTVSYPEAPALTCVKIGDVTWAPVNCGYDATHTYGSLYQWGRKYGQAYELGNKITLVGLSMGDGQSETKKNEFGKYDSSTYNWFSGSVVNTLWNGSSKGTYDPCPSGWRIPTSDELGNLVYSDWDPSTQTGTTKRNTDWDSTNHTRNFNGLILPAAGRRNYLNGEAVSRDSQGYCWSSSVTDNNARSLMLDDKGAVMTTSYRASGHSVRCVKEQAK